VAPKLSSIITTGRNIMELKQYDSSISKKPVSHRFLHSLLKELYISCNKKYWPSIDGFIKVSCLRPFKKCNRNC
jgi:hypothetical protein